MVILYLKSSTPEFSVCLYYQQCMHTGI